MKASLRLTHQIAIIRVEIWTCMIVPGFVQVRQLVSSPLGRVDLHCCQSNWSSPRPPSSDNQLVTRRYFNCTCIAEIWFNSIKCSWIVSLNFLTLYHKGARTSLFFQLLYLRSAQMFFYCQLLQGVWYLLDCSNLTPYASYVGDGEMFPTQHCW